MHKVRASVAGLLLGISVVALSPAVEGIAQAGVGAVVADQAPAPALTALVAPLDDRWPDGPGQVAPQDDRWPNPPGTTMLDDDRWP